MKRYNRSNPPTVPAITLNPKDFSEVGPNLSAAEVDGKLILVIDTQTTIGASATGKMLGVASTGGFAPLPGGVKANIYIGVKNTESVTD